VNTIETTYSYVSRILHEKSVLHRLGSYSSGCGSLYESNMVKAVPSYGAGGATAPPEKLVSEYNKIYLFIAASY